MIAHAFVSRLANFRQLAVGEAGLVDDVQGLTPERLIGGVGLPIHVEPVAARWNLSYLPMPSSSR